MHTGRKTERVLRVVTSLLGTYGGGKNIVRRRVPMSLKRALREEAPERILKSLAEWVVGHFAAENYCAA